MCRVTELCGRKSQHLPWSLWGLSTHDLLTAQSLSTQDDQPIVSNTLLPSSRQRNRNSVLPRSAKPPAPRRSSPSRPRRRAHSFFSHESRESSPRRPQVAVQQSIPAPLATERTRNGSALLSFSIHQFFTLHSLTLQLGLPQISSLTSIHQLPLTRPGHPLLPASPQPVTATVLKGRGAEPLAPTWTRLLAIVPFGLSPPHLHNPTSPARYCYPSGTLQAPSLAIPLGGIKACQRCDTRPSTSSSSRPEHPNCQTACHWRASGHSLASSPPSTHCSSAAPLNRSM